MTTRYQKPALDPSAPFDSPGLCLKTGRGFSHPVPGCGSLHPFHTNHGFIDQLAAETSRAGHGDLNALWLGSLGGSLLGAA